MRFALTAIAAFCTAVALPVRGAFPSDVAAKLNESVDPCDDFYAYACGGWEASAPMDEGGLTAPENHLSATINTIVNDSSNLVGKMYASCMNVNLIDSQGVEPLQPLLDRIDKLTKHEDLFELLGELWYKGIEGFHALVIAQDPRDATKYVLQLRQSTPTIKTPVVVNEDEALLSWTNYVTKVLQLTGVWEDDEAVETAQAVVELEIKLMKNYISAQEAEDPNRLEECYVPMTVREAKKKYPLLVGAYVRKMKEMHGLDDHKMVIRTPKFYKNGEQLLQETDIETLKAFGNVRIVHEQILGMPEQLRQAYIEFRTNTTGSTAMRDRSAACATKAQSLFPYLLGKLVYEAWQDDEGIKTAKIMLDMLLEGMKERIPQVSWLTEASKKRSLKKLAAVAQVVGYSNEVEEYAVDETKTFTANLEKALRVEKRQLFEELQKKVDRKSWGGESPAQVNAFYSPSTNEVVIPLGIMQSPVFNCSYHPVRTFGGLGYAVGHEITHGYDSNGRFYDEVGTLKRWCSAKDDEEFDKRAQCFVDQYSTLEVKNATGQVVTTMDGNATLAENIADNGGLKLARQAYNLFAAQNPEKVRDFDLAEDEVSKLFYLSTAQVWCYKASSATIVERVASDPHSFGAARVNGMMQNNKDFAEVFQCPAGSKMNPKTKCEIW